MTPHLPAGLTDTLKRIADTLGVTPDKMGGHIEVCRSGESIVIRLHDGIEARRVADQLAAGLCRRATGPDKRPCMLPQYHPASCRGFARQP